MSARTEPAQVKRETQTIRQGESVCISWCCYNGRNADGKHIGVHVHDMRHLHIGAKERERGKAMR